LTSKSASRHIGVQFVISHLPRWPDGSAPGALASLLFDPPARQNIGKHIVSRLFLHLLSSDSFSSLIFFILLFSSLTLAISAFHLSILSNHYEPLTHQKPKAASAYTVCGAIHEA
jgi:hypothetical protein